MAASRNLASPATSGRRGAAISSPTARRRPSARGWRIPTRDGSEIASHRQRETGSRRRWLGASNTSRARRLIQPFIECGKPQCPSQRDLETARVVSRQAMRHAERQSRLNKRRPNDVLIEADRQPARRVDDRETLRFCKTPPPCARRHRVHHFRRPDNRGNRQPLGK